MPYLKPYDRSDLDRGKKPTKAGELNYLLTQTIIHYTTVNGLSYNTINEVIGALECVKAEYYRRVAGPYEDKKIIENHDLYPHYLLTPKTPEGGTFGDGK